MVSLLRKLVLAVVLLAIVASFILFPSRIIPYLSAGDLPKRFLQAIFLLIVFAVSAESVLPIFRRWFPSRSLRLSSETLATDFPTSSPIPSSSITPAQRSATHSDSRGKKEHSLSPNELRQQRLKALNGSSSAATTVHAASPPPDTPSLPLTVPTASVAEPGASAATPLQESMSGILREQARGANEELPPQPAPGDSHEQSGPAVAGLEARRERAPADVSKVREEQQEKIREAARIRAEEKRKKEAEAVLAKYREMEEARKKRRGTGHFARAGEELEEWAGRESEELRSLHEMQDAELAESLRRDQEREERQREEQREKQREEQRREQEAEEAVAAKEAAEVRRKRLQDALPPEPPSRRSKLVESDGEGSVALVGVRLPDGSVHRRSWWAKEDTVNDLYNWVESLDAVATLSFVPSSLLLSTTFPRKEVQRDGELGNRCLRETGVCHQTLLLTW
eukprot:TRINITY_DN30029_c0_g1_i1.p1 TRINITY_DN30029_c0_g1~~TRINITY_DN30029_c0_g1_i1.p1  ORF type:complete len:516 (-),score=95.85 TRINITY_DN30029_c0_g1_i1:448-1809(-)